jgi:transcriptional regulator with XRE-family HTH domain
MANLSPKFQDRGLIGGLLEAIRVQHGRRLADVEIAIGVELSTWSRMENGYRSLKFVEAVEFCEYFKLTITQFHTLLEQTRAAVQGDESFLSAAGRVYAAFLVKENRVGTLG